jgi:hypothetical protein
MMMKKTKKKKKDSWTRKKKKKKKKKKERDAEEEGEEDEEEEEEEGEVEGEMSTERVFDEEEEARLLAFRKTLSAREAKVLHAKLALLSPHERLELLQSLRQKRRILAVESSWRNGLFGLLEARLSRLSTSYVVYAFNAEGFDLVLLCSDLLVHSKEIGLSASMHREGNRIRWLKLGGVHLAEVKRLFGAGTSLKKAAATCGVEEVKAIWPYDLCNSYEYLSTPRLPPLAADWASALNPAAAPTQEQVDEALRLFDERGFANVGEYLDYYLALDVTILLKVCLVLKAEYYRILGLDFVDSGKNTVSSLSALGAQMYLARNKRPGCFFPNHARLYSVRKKRV